MDAPLLPLGLVAVGGYLAWFGVRYWSSDVKWPSDPVKAVLTGKPLPDGTATPPTPPDLGSLVSGGAAAGTGSTSGAAAGGAVGSDSAIATDALKYQGAAYVYGGNADRVGNWDCSSFVSYVLGHDLDYPLPGGKWGDPGFPPHSHGPVSGSYMLFGTGVELKDVQAGDLIATTEHIGIAISPTQMISAQDEAKGTGISNFPDGFPGGPPVYRRVTGSGGTAGKAAQ